MPLKQPILVPVLGDQLTHSLASLRETPREDAIVLMMEVHEEATYVRHHQQKIVLIFSAMRHFAAELCDDGWTVEYIALDDPDNAGSFTGEVARAVERHSPCVVRVVEPGEWRVRAAMDEWTDKFACRVEILPDDRFICPIREFASWAQGRDHLTMEFFYREMRRKTGLLMDGDKPTGGRWNLDAENRRPPPKSLSIPPTPKFSPDAITREVMALVERRFGDHYGDLDHFAWPVTAQQAQAAADAFFADRLGLFGVYQDAMVAGEDDLYHSLLSTSINLGLLDPLELCRRAEAEYCAGRAPLNSVEGFIRQIIGWREFVRGFYWSEMPGLAAANVLEARRPLPEFYWTGETDMRCMADGLRSTHADAHAHHIQRLMVLGNFALLAGIDPHAVADWYLVVYADAYEWVELPNVAAMVLFADGGRLATRPYAASGNYINKMSDYCKGCRYDVKLKVGPDACPFNALYWDFMARHRERFQANPRIGRIYGTWDRLGQDRQNEYRASARNFLDTLVPARAGWARIKGEPNC